MTVPEPDPTGPAYVYRATAVRVHDGDTFTLRIDLGFTVSADVRVRLRGVDTPELKGSTLGRAVVVRDFVRGLLMPPPIDPGFGLGRPLLVRSFKDQRTFERWVCDVWFLDVEEGSGWASLADTLLERGYAVVMER